MIEKFSSEISLPADCPEELSEMEKKELEDQNRTRYLIEMSKKILERSQKMKMQSSGGHEEQIPNNSNHASEEQNQKNLEKGQQSKLSIPSLVETQNNSNHLKSRDDGIQ